MFNRKGDSNREGRSLCAQSGATASSHSRPSGPAWKLKGDGIAFTTSEEIFKSDAGKAIIKSASKIVIAKSE